MRINSSAVIVGGVALLIMLSGPAAEAGTPTAFIDSANREHTAAVDSGWTAWAIDSTKHPFRYTAYVQPSGGSATRINSKGTSAFVSNFELGGPHGNLLVYWQTPRGEDSDVKLYDLDAGTTSDPPPGINTSMDEENPSVSGDYLLFGRGPATKEFQKKIVLYQFTTDTSTVLATAPRKGLVIAGRVNGDFAVWNICTAKTCDVYRYQISTATTAKLPAHKRAEYWPTVMSDGTVYYVHGSFAYCGLKTRIEKYAPDGTTSTLASFPNGIEIGPMYGYNDGTQTTVYFTRIKCTRKLPRGIWQVTGA